MNSDTFHFSPSTCSKLQHTRSLKSALKSPNPSPGTSPNVMPGIKKSISFNNIPTSVDAPTNDDEDAIFWMNKKDFFLNVKIKSRLHGPQSLQAKFLNAWVSVMQNNYLMFEKIFKYRLSFDSSDIILDQSEISDERPIPFPDTETIEILQKEKDAVDAKCLELINVLEPAYLLNEELYNMMKNNYNAKTEINQKQFVELNKLSELVNNVTDRFDVVFNDFPIRTYIKHLKHIRKTMSKYEQGKIVREKADKVLKEDVTALEGCYPNLQTALNSATGIGLKEAQEAIIKFHTLVKKVLKVDKVSSSGISFKKLFSGLNIPKK